MHRETDAFSLSRSTVRRDGDGLTIELDERCAPWGGRLRGRVRLDIEDGAPRPLTLDRDGQHRWWPVGARAVAQVDLERPRVRFTGSGYHDCNFGDVPLEQSFHSWNWSRADIGDDVGLIYDVVERDGTQCPRALRLHRGELSTMRADHHSPLPRAWWGMHGTTRAHGDARRRRLLEDTPFYTRSVLETVFDGNPVLAMHESLDMTRFVRPWVQRLLPFRIRRGWRA